MAINKEKKRKEKEQKDRAKLEYERWFAKQLHNKRGSFLMISVILIALILTIGIIVIMNNPSIITKQSIGGTTIVSNIGQHSLQDYYNEEGDWIIDGDNVYWEDERTFINAKPHTVYGNGWVTFNFTSKVFTGDVDIVLGFPNGNTPTKIERYNPTQETRELSYTCLGTHFNYTTNPNYAWCYNGTEIVFESDFISGNLESQTIIYEENYIEEFKSISGKNFDSVNYNYQGMNKWWYIKNFPITQDTDYSYRVYIETEETGKYFFAIKPSSESISEAIENNHLYMLDPWSSIVYEYLNLVGYQTGGAQGVGAFGQNFTVGEVGLTENFTFTGFQFQIIDAGTSSVCNWTIRLGWGEVLAENVTDCSEMVAPAFNHSIGEVDLTLDEVYSIQVVQDVADTNWNRTSGGDPYPAGNIYYIIGIGAGEPPFAVETSDVGFYIYGTEIAPSNLDPTVTLSIPINQTSQTTDSLTLNCSATDDYSAVINLSLIIDGTTNYTIYNSTAGENLSLETTLSFNDGDYLWTCNATDEQGLMGETETRTFTIDATDPTLISITNLTNQVVFSLPTNSSWQFNVSDANIESCWYNTSETPAIIILGGCNETINNTKWATEGTKYVYYYANDTLGNQASSFATLNITLITADYSHTPDSTGELGSIFFDLYVNKTNTPTTSAYLWINNTRFDPTNTVAYTNYTYFNYTLAVPNGWGNSTGDEIDYYWNYSIVGFLDNRSTQTDNFTIYSMEMDNCSTFGIEILNFNLKDEEDNTQVNATRGSNIEVDVVISSGTTEWLFSGIYPNNETARVCVPYGVLNNSNYTIDYTVGFDSTDHVWEFLYLDNGILENNNEVLNSMTNKTKSLFDLLTADSTSFLFNYFNVDGLPVADSIVHVFRKYIGEGVFREVERAKQDESGDTIVHLVEEDVIYYFVISLDGEILFTSTTYTALCQAVPCTIQIEASGDVVEFPDDWDLVDNGSYSLTQDSMTRLVNLTYIFAESGTANLTLYQYNSDGEYVGIVSGEETGTDGTISLLVPSSVGNKTFFASIYKDDEFIRSEWISMEEDAGIYFGNSLALFLAFLVILCLGLMAISEGGATIIWVIIGLIITSAMGLIDMATTTGVPLLIYFICAGAIILWKLTRGRK